MKSYFLILIFACLTQIITSGQATNDYYDLNDADQHVHVVTLIISKLNTVLNETTETSHRLNEFNKRFDDLDQRVNKILEDFSTFKADISKQVQDQSISVQSTLTNTATFNKRANEIEKQVATSANDMANIRNDITKTVQDRNEAIKKELNEKFGEINQLLRKSSTDLEVFKTDISKTVVEHSTALRHKVNETLQLQERQQNQIKLLWENGSLNSKSEWHVILRRVDGSLEFNRNWTEYKNGFGDPAGEYFVGLEPLHQLTANGMKHEILIEMKDNTNHQTYAKYDNIVIGSEEEKYILKEVGQHSGDAEDALRHHMDEKFTTLDQDNDMSEAENCAQTYKGPWWFYQCNPSSNLFGPYHPKPMGHRMRWGVLKELKFIEVKIRQV